MEIFATLGQYLLLAFVLPGFCYLLVFALCFPGRLREMRTELAVDATAEKKESSLGLWMSFFAVTGGLLLSSVAFAIEIVFRRTSTKFDCEWFPTIPFSKIMENTLANFFTAETFMHFNIAVGIFIIIVIYLICGADGARRKIWLAACLAVLAVGNLTASAHLFERAADVALDLPNERSEWSTGCQQRHEKKAWF